MIFSNTSRCMTLFNKIFQFFFYFYRKILFIFFSNKDLYSLIINLIIYLVNFSTFVFADTSYRVTVKTTDVRYGGTSANVFCVFFGLNGDSGDLHLKVSYKIMVLRLLYIIYFKLGVKFFGGCLILVFVNIYLIYLLISFS